jgi:hypothetical protein
MTAEVVNSAVLPTPLDNKHFVIVVVVIVLEFVRGG